MQSTIKRIEKISEKWFFYSPFLNECILRLSFHETSDFPTIGINLTKDKRNIAVYYNESFMSSLDDCEFEAVILHEVLHLVCLTMERSSNRDRGLWNSATDYANNYEIEKTFIGNTKMRLPEYALRVENLKDKSGKPYSGPVIAEDIYVFLEKNSVSEEGERNFDDHKFLDNCSSVNKQIMKTIAKEMLDSAKNRSFGSISENIQEYIKAKLKNKPLFIEQFLRLTSSITTTASKFKTSSYKKLHRKGLDEFPGKKRIGYFVNIGVDVSGSISKKQLSNFFSEIATFRKRFPYQVIQFDSKVKSVTSSKELVFSEDIKIIGRGGTDIQCFFDYVSGDSKAALNIIFTDGVFNWNIDWKNNKHNTLFVLSGRDSRTPPVDDVKYVIYEDIET